MSLKGRVHRATANSFCLIPTPTNSPRLHPSIGNKKFIHIISTVSLSKSSSFPSRPTAPRDAPPQQNAILHIYQIPWKISRISKTSTNAPPKLLVLGNEVDNSKYCSAEKLHKNTTETTNISTHVMNAGVPTAKSRSETYCVRLNHWY